MEDIDREIVRLLANDGRMSFTDLGRATGLSVSAVHQRVRRLEQRGVVGGYAARIDPDAIGLPLTAFVSITPIDPAAPDDAPERLIHLEADRGLPLGGRPRELHPQGTGAHAGRAGAAAAADPGRRQRLDPDHDRAQHPVRGPPAPAVTRQTRPPSRSNRPS